jgi:hypothetical protein
MRVHRSTMRRSKVIWLRRPNLAENARLSHMLWAYNSLKWQSICRNELEDVMEHKTLDEIRDVADIQPSWLGGRPLTKCERLERWAEVLEREGGRRLKTLFEIEYLSRTERATLRADDSPLSVAFGDPQLRAEGLAGDTVGDAIAFFEVSEMEMHRILCFCCHGETMSANAAAARVRAAAVRAAWNGPLYLSPMLIGGVAAAMIVIGALAA